MNKHLDYIDFIKGVGIIAIVATHSFYETNSKISFLSHWYMFFMIAIFYVMIGWTANINNKRDFNIKFFLNKKFKTLVIPYISFSTLIIIFDLILLLIHYYNFNQILKDIYRTLCLAGIGTLWFIPTLYITELILYFILSKCKQTLYISILSSFIISTVSVLILNSIKQETMLFDIISAPVMVIIKGLIGYTFASCSYIFCSLITKIKLKLNFQYSLVVLIFFIFCLFLSNFLEGCDFNHLTMKNPIQWMLTAFLISISVILLVELIYTKLNSLKLIKFISSYGKNSLIIMCTHYSILIPLIDIIFTRFYGNNTFIKTPFDIFTFGIILVIEIPLIYIINRQIPFILGKSIKHK